MKFQSPGYSSILMFAAFDGVVNKYDDRTAVHTPDNLNFFWGNLLIFNEAPKKGDFKKWTQLFKDEFSDPRIQHSTLAWDTSGEKGEIDEFLEHGFQLEVSASLTAHSVVKPKKFNDGIAIRHVSTSQQWEEMIAIQLANANTNYLPLASWETFYRRQSLRYMALEKAGFGHWYGAYLNDKLVGGLGLYYHEGLARFQTVSTHPDFQRQGICQTLVYHASREVLDSRKADVLVMCADPDYFAIKIYESVGFKRQTLDYALQWHE